MVKEASAEYSSPQETTRKDKEIAASKKLERVKISFTLLRLLKPEVATPDLIEKWDHPTIYDQLYDENNDYRPYTTEESEEKKQKRIQRFLLAFKLKTQQRQEEIIQILEKNIELGMPIYKNFAQNNVGLLVSTAKKSRSKMPLEDKIQEGSFGLMRAVGKFDHRRRKRFSTLATQWIRQAIGKADDDKSRTIRLPKNASSTLSKISTTFNYLCLELEREPSPDEIAEAMGQDRKTLEAIAIAGTKPASLDETHGDEDSTTMLDAIPSEANTEAEALRGLNAEYVDYLLKSLDPRSRDILERRYGLKGRNEETLEEIGLSYHVSRERIRQIEQKAFSKLRKPPSLTKVA